MATFKIVVVKADQKSDKTWNVKVRVTHNRRIGYIGTDYYVTRKSINSKYEIINNDIILAVNKVIDRYRTLETTLGDKLPSYSLKQLTDFFKRDRKGDIDFIAFIDSRLEELKRGQKLKTWATYQTTKNRLIKFTGLSILPITLITVKFLEGFETWLRRHKENNEWKECNDTSINLYMRNIRALFNAARKQYNDEDLGDFQIKHYPFGKYDMPDAPETKKRNLSIETILAIRDYPTKRKLDIQAQDVFMLSFYFVGMNTVDMFHCPSVQNNRITYNRHKTEGKRKDKALISLSIPEEAVSILQKYKGKRSAFDFRERYANASDFNKYVNRGLKRIGEALNLPDTLSSYYARHSWATIARNDCRISEEDVHRALNHSNPNMKVTDIYLAKDWRFIDESQHKVIDYMNDFFINKAKTI
jgi:integrase